jgi:anion-transporting  ArsA/GET3 family ATPase
MLRTPRTFAEIARVGPIRRRADVIHDFITDGTKTGVVAVALPQEMPVNETIEFREKLDDEMGMGTDVVVMNALLPDRFTAADRVKIDAAEDAAMTDQAWAALHAARSEHSRARSQRAQLRRLKRDAGTDVITLPYLWEPELGLEDFERLADELERKL